MEVKASLRNARIGAQKARLVADVVRGKDVSEALEALAFLDKKAGTMFNKLIRSAVANADQKKTINVDSLFVKSVWVDAGAVLKRFVPKAQGRASEIRKKSSHLNVILDERL